MGVHDPCIIYIRWLALLVCTVCATWNDFYESFTVAWNVSLAKYCEAVYIPVVFIVFAVELYQLLYKVDKYII